MLNILEVKNLEKLENDTNAVVSHSTVTEKTQKAEEDVFGTILNENLGNHPKFSWFDVVHIDLPKIIIDDGLHIYRNSESMEKSGEFTYYHHKLVRKEDHKAPKLDLSVTSLVVYEWIALLLMGFMFVKARKHYKNNNLKAPKGIAGVLEALIGFVKNDIVKPNIGEKLTNKLLPYFVGLFLFILTLNLLGLLPGGHSATGNLAVTAVLAITAFFTIQAVSIGQNGIKNYLKHLTGGAPIYLSPIMVPIEIIGLFTKPFALTIRLFANMTAGHIIILCLLGLIFSMKSLVISPITVGFSLFIYALELLVAFLQAYIFTILTSVFIGLAVGEHASEH